MLKNYFITALRNFRNQKFYVLVNIFGLSIGITCCLVVYTILKHELTFDTWHEKSDEIYRVVEHYAGDFGMEYQPRLPNAFPSALNDQKSWISEVIMMHGSEDGLIDFYFENQYKSFQQEDILFANSAFLTNLDFPILQGAGPEILDQPYKIFLTESIARKYFGNSNPIGKFITYNEYHDLEVVGILKETPTNTNNPFKS
jgi:putative ABC transport system permease protein